MPNRKASRLTLALLGLALISSLALAQSAFSINPFLSANYGQITDADGNTISAMSDPSTPIHASRGSKPAFLAPDGHPLTLGEFDRVQGVAIAHCSSAGTHLTLNLSGLLPDGMYTLWLVIKEPGMDGAVTPVGLGSFGAAPGGDSQLIVAADGTSSISVLHSAGPLTNSIPPQPEAGMDERYVVGSCLFDEPIFEAHVIYHNDSLMYGDWPGPGETWATQAAFVFSSP